MAQRQPRYTSDGNFISSDYMLSRLTLDPQQTQRRLVDGFYEQKLVSDHESMESDPIDSREALVPFA